MKKKILVIDVGGTNVKILATGQRDVRKIPSGPALTAKMMVAQVKEAAADWKYEVVSIGYPGPIVKGAPLLEPRNLGPGWVGFDFRKAFGKPVRILNDAAMQALGSYEGGRMLFLGLGTGLGTALIIDGVIAPMELAHLPYRRGTFEDYVGERGQKRLGRKKWQAAVEDTVRRLKDALIADYVVLGGGNSKDLERLPDGARLGSNKLAFVGGQRMWNKSLV
jgi:polyphosphate glucokinase